MKRILSAITALTIAIIALPYANFEADAINYNPDAALAYAEKTWNNGIELCAGYVSNCLQAGGINVMERSVGNLHDALKGSYGTSYVLNTDGPYIYEDDNYGKIAAGDPVFYYCNSCKSFQHAILCGGFDDAGRMTDYAHNNPHHNTTTYISWGCPSCGAINWIMYTVHINTKNDVASYTISYNANGGNGAPASQIKKHGTNITLSSVAPIRSGYDFVCWNTKPDGSGTKYNPGSTYSANANVTLYAIWSKGHVHSYTKTVTKQANCASSGVYTYTCSCGHSYTENIPATDHNIVWVYSTRPSIYKAGTRHKECSYCHKKFSDNTTVAKVTGDVNGDKKVNSVDALTILRYAVGQANITAENSRLNADANGDGKINSSDALLILRISTNMI